MKLTVDEKHLPPASFLWQIATANYCFLFQKHNLVKRSAGWWTGIVHSPAPVLLGVKHFWSSRFRPALSLWRCRTRSARRVLGHCYQITALVCLYLSVLLVAAFICDYRGDYWCTAESIAWAGLGYLRYVIPSMSSLLKLEREIMLLIMIKNILCMLWYDRVSPYMGEREREETNIQLCIYCVWLFLIANRHYVCVCVPSPINTSHSFLSLSLHHCLQ